MTRGRRPLPVTRTVRPSGDTWTDHLSGKTGILTTSSGSEATREESPFRSRAWEVSRAKRPSVPPGPRTTNVWPSLRTCRGCLASTKALPR